MHEQGENFPTRVLDRESEWHLLLGELLERVEAKNKRSGGVESYRRRILGGISGPGKTGLRRRSLRDSISSTVDIKPCFA